MGETKVETQDTVVLDAGGPDVVALDVGSVVEVRSRFDRRWTRGFSVAAVASDAYQLRRDSDGTVLPAWFPTDDVRAAGAA